MCLFQSSQFVTNRCGTEVHSIFAHESFGCNGRCAMNIFFNKRTQYLLLALAQWYHLLIHLQNMKLLFMILHLSMMIASSLKWRLQIQNSTGNLGLSSGFSLHRLLLIHKFLEIAYSVTFSLFLRLN